MREPRPPVLARWLLRRICRPRFRDVVEGDAEELFLGRVAGSGRRRARIRYWADVLSLLGTAHARGRNARDHGSRWGLVTEEAMNTLNDLRHAVRSLVKTPAFSAVVVITLALAIGANTAIFGVVDAVLLRPLPYDEPEAVVVVAQRGPESAGMSITGASQNLFLTWRESGRSFEQIAFYSQQEATITSLDEPVRMNGLATSPALFPLLRVDALHGRTFTPDEEKPGQDDVIVLEHGAWQRHFGGDPSVVGSTLTLDDRLRTIVGVMPPGFRFPDDSMEYWVPMLAAPPDPGAPMTSGARVSEEVERDVRRARAGGPGDGPTGGGGGDGGPGGQPEAHMELWGRVVARLADGVSTAMAAEEGATLLRGLNDRSGGPDVALDGDDVGVDVIPMQEQLVGSVRRSLLLLMGAVGFVLLIACANVANLVMARSAGRRKETAVRSALGAGWWTLSRYLLIESLVLAAAGGLLGLALASGGLRMLGRMGPEFIPRLEGVGIDVRVLGFTMIVTVFTAVLFSLVPARGAAKLDLTRALKEEHGAGLRFGRDALRKLLVTAEVALSVILLVGAGLLVNSFIRLSTVDPGYDARNLLHLNISVPADAYGDAASHLNYYDALVERFEALPGVEAATVASQPPYLPANIRIAMSPRRGDEPPSPDDRPTPVGVRVVENRYFDTLRAQAAQGRTTTRDDRPETQAVAVLSESAAEAIFQDREIGETIPFIGGQQFEVVGIVDDVRTAGVDPTPQADVFLPYRQAPERMIPMLFRTAHVLVRTGPAPLSVLPSLRDALRQIDSRVLVLSVATVGDRIADSVAEPRFYATLVAAFALLALSLAAVGIYGLLSYTVQEGVRETAIRRALGAPVARILRNVVTQGMVLAAIGLLIGIGVALGLTRLLESMLYEIEPTDPLSFVMVVAVFLGVAFLAILMPARRATRIDPMDVLRYE